MRILLSRAGEFGHSTGITTICTHFFFFQAEDGIRDADVTGVQTCALPIFGEQNIGKCRLIFGHNYHPRQGDHRRSVEWVGATVPAPSRSPLRAAARVAVAILDRKSTRLNSSHVRISYAVFCLNKKK